MSRNGQKRSNRKLRSSVVAKRLEKLAKKERTEVAKEVTKLQQLAAGDADPHIQQLYRQFKELLDGHNHAVTGFNQNFQAYSKAIQHLDARLSALMMVVDDLVSGGVDNVTRLVDDEKEGGSLGGVHWEAYIRLHISKIKEQLAAQQAQAAAATESAEEETPLARPGDHIFGGDDHEIQPEQPGA